MTRNRTRNKNITSTKQNETVTAVEKTLEEEYMDIMKDLLKNVEGVKRKDIKNMTAPIEYPDLTIYPFDYFTCTFWTTDFVEITDRSYGIQLYGASWRRDDKKAKIYERIQNIFKKF